MGAGFTALLGVNNSGKSALLKFFYDFRDLFLAIASNRQALTAGLAGRTPTFAPQKTISDLNELFCNSNNHDLTIHFRVPHNGPQIPREIVVTVPRGSNTWRVELRGNEGALDVRDARIGSTTKPEDEGKSIFIKGTLPLLTCRRTLPPLDASARHCI